MKKATTYRQGLKRLTGLIVATIMLGATGYAQEIINKTITHKKGQTQLYTNEYGFPEQKTATQKSVIYAIPGGAARVLKLPPYCYGGASPTSNYVRWYDYKTDGYPNGLTLSIAYNNYDCGAFITNNSSLEVQSAKISLANSESERIIACDVSGYKDYNLVTNPVLEPTLSYRSVFQIKDAHIIADQLKECVGDKFLEEKTVYMPEGPHLGKEKPKVTLDYDDDNYFGYNNNTLVNINSSGNPQLISSTSDTYEFQPGKRSRTTINIYESNGVYLTLENINTRTGRFCSIIPGKKGEKIQAKVLWNYGKTTTTKKILAIDVKNDKGEWIVNSSNSEQEIDTKKEVYITYNLAKFNIEFIDRPAQYVMSESNEKSIKYLDDNYVLLASQNFDYDKSAATSSNNCYTKPLDNCSYGFVYPQLYNSRWISNRVAQWNEYGFYKTAQVPGISNNNNNNYYWYNNGNPVRDRLYYNNQYENKSKPDYTEQNGYFMYIDASNMPGTVAKLKFDTPLCPGTKLIVSAGICNLVSESHTDGDINFVFKGVTKDGKEVELNRYTSGNIPKVLNSSAAEGYGGENGKEWYQAYYTFTINSEIEFDYYLIQVDNNASNTTGGDYAVDDIRVYRSKPGIEAMQTELPCGDEIPKVKIKVEFEKLIAGLPEGSNGRKNLRYRFLDEDKNILAYDYGNKQNYGEIQFSTILDDHSNTEVPIAGADVLAGRETSATGTEYLVFLTPNNETLKQREWYYVAIANAAGVFEDGICGLISLKFRIEPPSYITVDGVPDIDTSGLCFGQAMEISAALKDRITMELIPEGYRFDWYLGLESEFADVNAALQQYRLKDPNPVEGNTNLKTVAFDENYTQRMHQLLQREIETGKLFLNTADLKLVVQKDADIRAIVIPGTITSVNAKVCNDVIVFYTSNPGKTPLIVLGTQYGESKTSTIRMSLAQFKEMANGKKLEIPIWDYKDSEGGKGKTLRPIENDNDIQLTGTNDNYKTDLTINIGKLTSITQNNKNLLVSIAPSTGFVPHEGYYYRMLFYFEEEKGGINVCYGSVEFNIKIVPEHLTWTGKHNDNWNNDANWKRSTSEELYDASYTNDTESQGYVPLDFSKVTIANTTTAPWLYKVEGAKGTRIQDLTNSNDAESTPTEYIESDMVTQTKNDNTYNCINFYANACDQIYFKPQAEMRSTHYLNYNKAWTDFELTSGRWYMLASPLQGVVAGDMYLPTNGGRQETKAFESITFAADKNNRFNPAVYQRSWDHASSTIIKRDNSTEDAFVAASWSNVYNKVDEKYEAAKGYSIRPIYGTAGTDKVLFRLPKADESYNYYTYSNDGTGVSGSNTPVTRANAGKLNDFASENGEIKINLTNTSDNSNFFLIGNPYMATLDMRKFFEQNTSFEKKFWIMTENGQAAVVFNESGTITTSDPNVDATVAPMQSFFVEKSTQTRSTTSGEVVFKPSMTVVKPQNGTLLKIKTRASEPEIENKRLYISAEREGKRSSILIEQRDDASDSFVGNEDVEALIDSNLGDCPILYSISGNRAASINVMSDQEFIPLGIHSDNNEEITLTFNGIENFSSELALYDAQLNSSTPIKDEETAISIPGNTHGRYYLTMSPLDRDDNSSNIQIYSTEKNKIIVTASPDKLQKIQIYNINGMLIKELTNLNSISEEINLASGFYVIHVESEGASYTGKVNCLN